MVIKMREHRKKQIRVIVTVILSSVLISVCMSGCSLGKENKKTEEKISIKVQYLCGRMNLDLEAVLEEKFPDIDIVTDANIQPNVPT